jgi:hypothetical protein
VTSVSDFILFMKTLGFVTIPEYIKQRFSKCGPLRGRELIV